VRKLAGYADRYRLRVGDYRVIYEIVERELIILVVGVGHRREVCRNLPAGPGYCASSRPQRR
jgi:mRNA interferase RelE/StbE